MRTKSTTLRLLGLCSLILSVAITQPACKGDSESTEPETTAFVVPDHPYMLLTADRKAQILENIESETMGQIYERIQSQALKELQSPEAGTWDAKLHGDNAEVALFNAFIAWLKDDNAEDAADLPEPAVLAREAVEELNAAVAELEAILVELGDVR